VATWSVTLLSLLLLLLQGAPPASGEIIVTGQRLEMLRECEERRCSTPEDVRRSIAYAEALFARGKYSEARAALSAAVSRQRQNARQFPRLIAALYEASATINLHLGDMGRYRTAIIAQGRTLGENLPEDDPQVLLNRVELGNFWLKQHQYSEARRQFESAAQSYARRGELRLSALCQLRVVALDIALRSFAAAEKRLELIGRLPAAADPAVRLMNAVMVARLASARGKDVDVDALIATLRAEPSASPVLVRSGPTPPEAQEQPPMFLGEKVPDPGRTSLRWVDVGYMIGPDGRVSDVEVLRSSRGPSWVQAYLAEIAGRRYVPVDLPPGIPGIYRVERYTLRAALSVPKGSLIKQATGRTDVVVTDLTGRHVASRKK
jgi:hypothetical protein